MIVDLIENNLDGERLAMSKVIGEKTNKLRQFMFDNVYLNKEAKKEDEKAEYIIEVLYDYYRKNFHRLPSEHPGIYKSVEVEKEDIICDYIAGMTDRYIVNLYMDLFVPKPWGKY